MATIRPPVITGVAIGLAVTGVMIILTLVDDGSNVESSEDRQFANFVTSLNAARESPAVKAFIEKYPDASTRLPEERETDSNGTGNFTAIEMSEKVVWTAYYNSTTGTIINDENAPIDNETSVITSTNSHKVTITNTMRLLVHVVQHTDSSNRITLEVVPVWLRCSTEALPGSSMTAELVDHDTRDTSKQTKAKEDQMIQYIRQGECFPSNLP